MRGLILKHRGILMVSKQRVKLKLVINNDKGTEFNGKLINIGDQVVDQLKENDLM